jgi:diguanylate cyclase (GGDEF)-like protein
VAAGRPVGFLFFSSLRRDTYAAVHVQVFQEITNSLSVVVERAHMLEQLGELNATLTARNHDLKRANARVRRMTVTDPLTRIANRRGLMSALRMESSFSDRHKVPLSVIAFDVDHFKRVNDTYGHDVGDQVLRHVAQLASKGCRTEDLVGRSGGEEFLVVLPATDEASAALVAERMRARLATPPVCNSELRVTASFGVAQRAPGEAIDSVLVRADRALYDAKDCGRNTVARASTVSASAALRAAMEAQAREMT